MDRLAPLAPSQQDMSPAPVLKTQQPQSSPLVPLATKAALQGGLQLTDFHEDGSSSPRIAAGNWDSRGLTQPSVASQAPQTQPPLLARGKLEPGPGAPPGAAVAKQAAAPPATTPAPPQPAPAAATGAYPPIVGPLGVAQGVAQGMAPSKASTAAPPAPTTSGQRPGPASPVIGGAQYAPAPALAAASQGLPPSSWGAAAAASGPYLAPAPRAAGPQAAAVPGAALTASGAAPGLGPLPQTYITAQGQPQPSRPLHQQATELHQRLATPVHAPTSATSGAPGTPVQAQAAARASQRRASHVPPVFTLDQLPPEQRIVHVTDVQANDLVQQLAAQSMLTGAVPPRVVDVKVAHSHFVASLERRLHTYVHNVEAAAPSRRLPVNARPSLLQTRLLQEQCTLVEAARPVTDPGQQGFVDLAYRADGVLLEETGQVWQCGVQLVRAEGVGPTGLRDVRTVRQHVARLAIFDRARHRFVGNIATVSASPADKKGSKWQFNPQNRLILRCNCVQPDPRTGTRLVNEDSLALFVELNTSYRLEIEDTKGLPPHEHRAARMVDEITSAWCLLSLKRCCTAAPGQDVSVPLYYGSLYDPQPLDALYKAKRKQHPLSGLMKPKPQPVLIFKAGPLAAGPVAPLLPYGYLPTTLLAPDRLAMAMGAFRVVLALQLARNGSGLGAFADPVLSGFLDILSEGGQVLAAFLGKWEAATTKLRQGDQGGCMSVTVTPSVASVAGAFRRCVVDVAPLLRSQTLPAQHIANFVEYQERRGKLIKQFCQVVDPKTGLHSDRHPVEPLSHAGFEFLHKPFDVSETRVCFGDNIQRHKLFKA